MASKAEKYMEQDRNYAAQRGNEMTQQAKDAAWNDQQMREFYRLYGNEVYDPLIGGRGGYSPEEQAAIMREQELKGTVATPEEYQQNYLTPDEINATQGRPWDRARYFNPDAMTGAQDQSAGLQRGAVGEMQQGIYSGITPDLYLSGEYSSDQDAALGGTESRVRGAVDPTRIRADEAALNDIRMSPEERQALVTGAGITVGNRYRSEVGDLERSARAAGVDAIGVAAAKNRYGRSSAADAADAMTMARARAGEAAATRAATAENLRMGGETTAANLGSSTELALGGRRLAATSEKEGLRLGAERDVSGRTMGAAETVGKTKLGAEQDINAQGRQVSQYNTGVGTDLATGIERDTAARAAAVAQNRQAVSQGNQAQRYQQGYQTNAALSGRSTGVADERLKQAEEGRRYLSDQGAAASAREQADLNRQAQIYGTQGQLMQGSTQTQMQKEAQPALWEKIAGAGIGVLGAIAPKLAAGDIVTKPTIAVVGEAGPEAVVPLTPQANPRITPGAMRYMSSGPQPRIDYGSQPNMPRMGMVRSPAPSPAPVQMQGARAPMASAPMSGPSSGAPTIGAWQGQPSRTPMQQPQTLPTRMRQQQAAQMAMRNPGQMQPLQPRMRYGQQPAQLPAPGPVRNRYMAA